MSLLMDALRKAEADKQQGDGESDKEKLALTSEVQPGGAPRAADPPADDSDPSINVSFAETVDLGRATRPVARPPAEETSLELTLEPLAYAELLDDTSGTPTEDRETKDPDPGATAPPASATSTMPSMRGVEQDLETYFDESQSSTAPSAAPDPLDPIADTPPPSTESGITETVASAHTVFEAGGSGPSKRIIGFGLVGALLIGCILVAAGFYYFHQAPSTQALPSPSVAINVEKAVPRELPIVPVAPTQPTVTEEPVRIEADTVTQEPPFEPGDPTESTSITAADPAPLDLLESLGADVFTPVGATTSTPESDATEQPITHEPSVQAPESLRFQEVRIARSDSKAATEPMINEAYAAYVAGDYVGAERGYAAVLEQHPDRRDALLGMAALKLRDGDVATAHRLYRNVLKRDPDNATAQAALFALERGATEGLTESRLKALLEQGVDDGYIYFSLGNLYARNRRWADAQQAYFEALRHHPANPDYNYNLAVSLDRIGQRDTALKYYKSAVNLTDETRAGFDPAQALARIQAINSAPAP